METTQSEIEHQSSVTVEISMPWSFILCIELFKIFSIAKVIV